jgi:hypothetical protein
MEKMSKPRMYGMVKKPDKLTNPLDRRKAKRFPANKKGRTKK